jgi:hypothetical protein
LVDEAADSYAHGWAAGAHHCGEERVRERDVEQHPLGGHGAPPVSEVPEHQQKPIVDAAQVTDR